MVSSYMLPYHAPTTCKLPSIHLLLLDLPPVGPPPQNHHAAFQPYGTHHRPILPVNTTVGSPRAPKLPLLLHLPPMAAPVVAPMPRRHHSPSASPTASPESMSSVSSEQTPSTNQAAHGLSTLCNAASISSSAATSSPAPLLTRTRSLSDLAYRLLPAFDRETPKEEFPLVVQLANESVTSEAELDADSPLAKSKTSWKPRKKRQCPECKLYFSNLATHKSTHLKPTSRPHICKYCDRGFARPNDLFRHVKCHWKEIGSDKGQFKCPFKNHHSGDHCLHLTGIFLRCDTFKNHLKAIHFQYPNGTKKDQRNKVAGTCRMCHSHFTNVDDWLTNHVEKNECPFTGEVKLEA